MPSHRSGGEGGGVDEVGDAIVGRDQRAGSAGERRRGQASHLAAPRSPAGPTEPSAGRTTAVSPSRSMPSASASTTLERRRRRGRGALVLEDRGDRRGRVERRGRRASPSASSAASRSAPDDDAVACWMPLAKSSRSASSIIGPLRGRGGGGRRCCAGSRRCRRRWWRRGSRGSVDRHCSLAASSPSSTSSARPSRARSKIDCSVVARRILSIDVSGPSRSPAAIRCWVARERARSAKSCWKASPTSSGRRAPVSAACERAPRACGAGRRRGARGRCCARRAAGPSPPPSPGPRRPACDRRARARRRRRPRRTPRVRGSS